jgi:hypothetical protein
MCAYAFSTDVAAQLRHEMHGDAAVSWQYLCSGVGASALKHVHVCCCYYRLLDTLHAYTHANT